MTERVTVVSYTPPGVAIGVTVRPGNIVTIRIYDADATVVSAHTRTGVFSTDWTPTTKETT